MLQQPCSLLGRQAKHDERCQDHTDKPTSTHLALADTLVVEDVQRTVIIIVKQVLHEVPAQEPPISSPQFHP